MSVNYSFSRVQSFDSCKLQYKYRYIDRLHSEIETVEAFMGSRVHEALRELYDFVKNATVKPMDWLLRRYEDLWQKNFSEAVKVVKKEYCADDYFRKGLKCLTDYYDGYAPFDRTKVVKTEEKVSYTLRSDGDEYSFTGYVDRIDWNDRERIFEIHDYKTSGTLMSQEEADRDFQLGLYQLALQARWPEAKEARLVWHYLLFNKKIESRRSPEDLARMQDEFVRRIKVIEGTQDFGPEKSSLCEWCGYEDICPLWAHPKKTEKLSVNAYLNDPGVKLVSRYAELEAQKKELNHRIDEIEIEQAEVEEAAVVLAEKENVLLLDGPGHQLVITIGEEICAPTRAEDQEKWAGLRDTLLRENRFCEVATVNNGMLGRMLKNWPREFLDQIRPCLVKKIVRKADLKKKR